MAYEDVSFDALLAFTGIVNLIQQVKLLPVRQRVEGPRPDDLPVPDKTSYSPRRYITQFQIGSFVASFLTAELAIRARDQVFPSAEIQSLLLASIVTLIGSQVFRREIYRIFKRISVYRVDFSARMLTSVVVSTILMSRGLHAALLAMQDLGFVFGRIHVQIYIE